MWISAQLREVWRLRKDEGVWSDPISRYDCAGLYLMEDNIPAAKDTVALVAATLEQGTLDQGRLEIASLLCLQEDVPAGVFMNRHLAATSRSRSFSPLADQKWIICPHVIAAEIGIHRRGEAFFKSLCRSRSQAKVQTKPEKKRKTTGCSSRRTGLSDAAFDSR